MDSDCKKARADSTAEPHWFWKRKCHPGSAWALVVVAREGPGAQLVCHLHFLYERQCSRKITETKLRRWEIRKSGNSPPPKYANYQLLSCGIESLTLSARNPKNRTDAAWCMSPHTRAERLLTVQWRLKIHAAPGGGLFQDALGGVSTHQQQSVFSVHTRLVISRRPGSVKLSNCCLGTWPHALWGMGVENICTGDCHVGTFAVFQRNTLQCYEVTSSVRYSPVTRQLSAVLTTSHSTYPSGPRRRPPKATITSTSSSK